MESSLPPGLGSCIPYTGSSVADITVPHTVRTEAAARRFITATMAKYHNQEDVA